MENIIDQIELYLNKFESPLKVSERSLMNKVYKIKKLSEIHNLKDFLELVKTIYVGKSTCVYNENIQLERAKEYYNTQSKDLEVLKSLLFDKKQIYIYLLSRLNNPKYKFYKSLIEDYVFKVPKNVDQLIDELGKAVQYIEMCTTPTIVGDIPSIDKLYEKYLDLLVENGKLSANEKDKIELRREVDKIVYKKIDVLLKSDIDNLSKFINLVNSDEYIVVPVGENIKNKLYISIDELPIILKKFLNLYVIYYTNKNIIEGITKTFIKFNIPQFLINLILNNILRTYDNDILIKYYNDQLNTLYNAQEILIINKYLHNSYNDVDNIIDYDVKSNSFYVNKASMIKEDNVKKYKLFMDYRNNLHNLQRIISIGDIRLYYTITDKDLKELKIRKKITNLE